MPFTASQFESDAVAEPSEEEKEQQRLAEANAAVQELGEVLARRRREQGGTLTASEPGLLSRIRRSDFGRSLFGPTREEREAMVSGGTPGLLEIPKTMLKFTTAPPQITEPIRELSESVISKLAPIPAGVARGVRDVAIGALGSLPAGALMAPRLVAAPFAAEYASALPEQFQAIREAETPGEAALALTTTGLGAGLTIAGAGEALRPQRRVAVEPQERPIVLEPERIQDASQIRSSEEVLPVVRSPAEQVPQEVPAQTGAERVSPPTGQAVQEEVLLKQETPTPAATEAGTEVIPARQIVPVVEPAAQVKPPLPREITDKPLSEALSLVDKVTNKELSAYPGGVGGATGFMHDLGSLAKTPADVAALKDFAAKSTEQRKTLMKEGKFDEAFALVGRQPAEAYEFATGVTLEGVPKWETFERFVPGYKPSVPDPKYVQAKQREALTAPVPVEQSPGEITPLQVREQAPEQAARLSEMSQGLRAQLEAIPQAKRTTAQEKQLSELRQNLPEARQAEEVALRQMRQPEISDASQRLQQTPSGSLAVQAVSPEFAQGRSSQALGIVPSGSGRLMEIIDKAIGKPKEVGPAIKTEIDTPFPDYNEHSASKKIFSQPFGFENLPVLGALFGGTRRLKGHVNESLSTYWAEIGIGKAIPSVFGNEYSWLRKPFEIKDGQIVNITPKNPGASRYISDLFEGLQRDPNAYSLNTEQRKAFDAIQALEKDFSRLETKYKIGKGVDDEVANPAELLNDTDVTPTKEPYFPRIVTSRPEGITAGLTRGSSVGAKAFFEKPRLFDTEAEGWARGYKYEPDIVNRLATRAERLYKRIADKRLANDPSLEGVSRKEVEAQLKASFAEELVSGEMTEKKISQMADSIEARGRVYSPAFFNKIFPEATANQLNQAFPKSQSVLRQWAVSLNNATKGLQLGLDMGVGFIQGQALLARHPAIWGKAQFNSVASMFHKEYFPEYVRKNLEPIRELAQLGSSVGKLEEYMAGLEGKELLSRIPGVKAVTAPFARQFQTFLDVAKVEMWKGIRETVPREQWADAVQTIESQLFGGRMEGAGISPGRALIERALFLAPAYYRGGLNNLALLTEGKFSGASTRKAMVAYATVGAVLYYGMAKQLGMSDEEIAQRMNPARSDSMMWRIKIKDRISNIGFGGFYRSLLRLMGNIAKTSLEHPENWASLSPDKNPITKWYRGHAGPVVTAIWDGFSGKDYLGEDVDIPTVARRMVTPITVQSARGRAGQPTPGAAEAALSFVGVQSFPATSKTELNKLHSEWLANNKDPKIQADYERNQGKPRERSKYAGLITGLLDKDEKVVASEIKKLRAEGVKRSDIYKRFNPYTASGEAQKPLFHETATLESKFRKSLTPEQMKLYEQARKDRLEQWRLFLKLWKQ